MTTSNPKAVVLVANLEPPLKWDSTSGKVKLDANATPIGEYPSVEAGGFVANTGGTVTLDNITVTSTGAGNVFTLKTVSGTLSYDISGWCIHSANANAQFASSRAALTMTTAAANPFWWPGTGYRGNSYELTIVDRTNSKVYQVTGMVGDATNNAFVKIKRIH